MSFIFDGASESNPIIPMTDDENLDFSIDYTRLLESDETIDSSSSVWTVANGLTKGAAGVDSAGKIATQWLSAGTAGETYQVDNVVETSEGRKYERSFRVQVVSRR